MRRTNWVKMLVSFVLIGISAGCIEAFFNIWAARTHMEIISWLGILAIPVILIPAMLLINWIVQRRKKGRGEKNIV